MHLFLFTLSLFFGIVNGIASSISTDYHYSVSKSFFQIPDEIVTDKERYSQFSIRCVFGRDYEVPELMESLTSEEKEIYPYLSEVKNPKRLQIARSVRLALGSLSTSYTYETSGAPVYLNGLSEPFFQMDYLRESPEITWVSFILSGSVQREDKTMRKLITTHSIPILPLKQNTFHVYIKSIGVTLDSNVPYVMAEIYDKYQPLDLYTKENSLRAPERKSEISSYVHF